MLNGELKHKNSVVKHFRLVRFACGRWSRFQSLKNCSIKKKSYLTTLRLLNSIHNFFYFNFPYACFAHEQILNRIHFNFLGSWMYIGFLCPRPLKHTRYMHTYLLILWDKLSFDIIRQRMSNKNYHSPVWKVTCEILCSFLLHLYHVSQFSICVRCTDSILSKK